MAIFYLDVVIIFLPDLDYELICLLVFETNEIQLIGIGLARMPYLVEIRFNTHAPTEDQCIKIRLIHAFLNKHCPLQEIGAHINADLFPGVLGDG